MIKLKQHERTALQLASGARSATAQEMMISVAQAAGLVRRGLLKSMPNSERVRGERRVYWQEYRTTEAGTAALQG